MNGTDREMTREEKRIHELELAISNTERFLRDQCSWNAVESAISEHPSTLFESAHAGAIAKAAIKKFSDEALRLLVREEIVK